MTCAGTKFWALWLLPYPTNIIRAFSFDSNIDMGKVLRTTLHLFHDTGPVNVCWTYSKAGNNPWNPGSIVKVNLQLATHGVWLYPIRSVHPNGAAAETGISA